MKKFMALLLALVMVLSLAACGAKQPAPEQPSQSAVETKPEESKDEAPTEAEAPADGVKKGGIMQFADTAGECNSLSWLDVSSYCESMAVMFVYETLFIMDKDGNVVPHLCESYTTDKENLQYVLNIRPGITFSDGSPLDAETVAWNLNLYKEKGCKSSGYLSNVESIEATDSSTVVIHLTTWDSTLPDAFTKNPGRMQSKASYDANGEEYCIEHPVGTGPFVLTSWTRDVNKTYDKNANYWQGEPNLDGINLTLYNDTLVAQAAVQNGEADVMFVSDFSMAKTMQDLGYKIQTAAQPARIFMLCYDELDESDPLCDLKVRQAISYALDKDAIASAIFKGFASPTNQFAYPGSVFYNNDVKGYEYNLEKAKQLMAESSYPNGFTTTLTTRQDTAMSNVAAAIQEMLKPLGIEVELDIVDGGTFGTVLTGWGTGMFEHNSGLPSSITAQMNTMFRQGLSGNVLGLTTLLRPDELNDAILEAVGSEKPEDAEAAIQKAQKIMFDDYCIFSPIVVTYDTLIKGDRLKDDGMNEITLYQHTLWKAWLAE